MKKTALILAILTITLSVFGQSEEPNTDEMKTELENQKDDTTNIRFKKKTVKIYEDDGETQIFVKKHRKHDNDWDWDWFWDDEDRFKGSWSGFSMGLSNLVDENFSLSRDVTEQYMDLHSGKSWNMNINFAQYSINFVNNKFGLVTGLGIEWNYYRFDNDNSIQKDATTRIIENRDLAVDQPTWDIEKSKLSTTYITLPMLLEIHSSSNQNSGVVFSAGAIGGLKLGSNTKIVYKENDNRNKEKTKDDFNLSPFRYGVHARLGVGAWMIYGTYYFNSLFIKDKGPELYPISVGFALSFE
ncbi:MAG: outer membrane beta-barrel protein [Bacteroidales bacterium]|nr:outer membrane beta-barrel protein [Bacteroidales bacterium]